MLPAAIKDFVVSVVSASALARPIVNVGPPQPHFDGVVFRVGEKKVVACRQLQKAFCQIATALPELGLPRGPPSAALRVDFMRFARAGALGARIVFYVAVARQEEHEVLVVVRFC